VELISTILKIDLAVLTVLLGLAGFFYKWLRDTKADTAAAAAKAATERAETIGILEFHGQRIDNLENWRAAISEIRRPSR
jgi:hypothetical protein